MSVYLLMLNLIHYMHSYHAFSLETRKTHRRLAVYVLLAV